MKSSGKINIIKICIALFLAVSVVIPLIRMLIYMFDTDIGKVLSSVQFTNALTNSITATTVATVLSLVLALGAAWCVTRSGIKYKAILSIVLTLPMLIPSISHGMGLIILFGNNGVITNFLGINGNIYGFWGIVSGSVMYSFPVAFLMLADVMKYEDSSPYEAANVLGISKWRQFVSITLPYLRKPLISVIFALFTMIVTDYGVPLMLRGNYTTLPVMMYDEAVGQLNFAKGTVIGAVLLIPALAAFIIDVLNKDRGNSGYVIKQFEMKKNRVRDFFSYSFCAVLIVCILLPIFSYVLLTFTSKYPSNISFTLNHIKSTFTMDGGTFLINSFIIALGVSIVGIVVVFITAYLTARLKSKMSKLLHLISITSLAIPGLVLGLAYVLVFNGTFMQGTIALLILVNIVHFFASPYLMMYNTFNKLNENLEIVGLTLGVGRMHVIKDVIVPQTKSTIIELGSYFFVNSMMTISAVSFLSAGKIKPISLMLSQFEAQMLIECAAFVSLLILTVNVVIKGIVYILKRRMAKKERNA